MKQGNQFRKSRLSEQEYEEQIEPTVDNDLSAISDIDLYSLNDKVIQILIARIKDEYTIINK